MILTICLFMPKNIKKRSQLHLLTRKKRVQLGYFFVNYSICACSEVTFVKRVRVFVNILFSTSRLFTRQHMERALVLQFTAVGQTVIRGLVTDMLMVRHESCDLIAWITMIRAHIGTTQMTRTLK